MFCKPTGLGYHFFGDRTTGQAYFAILFFLVAFKDLKAVDFIHLRLSVHREPHQWTTYYRPVYLTKPIRRAYFAILLFCYFAPHKDWPDTDIYLIPT